MTREEYLSAVEEQIRCKKVRPMVRRELEDHIQDQRDAYISEGKIGREAEKLAVCQMGDPVETGRALDRIHRPRMEWMLPLMAVLLSACDSGIITHSCRTIYYESQKNIRFMTRFRHFLFYVMILIFLVFFLIFALTRFLYNAHK